MTSSTITTSIKRESFPSRQTWRHAKRQQAKIDRSRAKLAARKNKGARAK